MKKFVFALLALSIICSSAEAGPFRRRSSGGSVKYSAPVGGDTSSAQGVAEIQARTGNMGHYGGNNSYEGVGMGPTPQSALNACCNNGRPVADQGVAQGSNGMWYACKRYR